MKNKIQELVPYAEDEDILLLCNYVKHKVKKLKNKVKKLEFEKEAVKQRNEVLYKITQEQGEVIINLDSALSKTDLQEVRKVVTTIDDKGNQKVTFEDLPEEKACFSCKIVDVFENRLSEIIGRKPPTELLIASKPRECVKNVNEKFCCNYVARER